MGFRPIGGGGGSARTPVLVSGSPFADLASLETWSQANPTELHNDATTVANAQVGISPDFITYEWIGPDMAYQADSWSNKTGLNNLQTDAVNSIISSPDNAILRSFDKKIAPSLLTQTSDTLIEGETELSLLNRDVLNYNQFAQGEAANTILLRDRTLNTIVTYCGVPVDFTVGAGQKITGKPYSLEWGEYLTFDAQTEEDAINIGNYSFAAPVSFNRVISKFTFKVASPVTGVRVVIRETDQNGPVILKSHTDAEWQSGNGIEFSPSGLGVVNLVDFSNDYGSGYPFAVDTSIPLHVTVEKFQNPSEIQLIGTLLDPQSLGVFLPYLTQEYFLEERSELVNAKIYTPVYKDGNSTDLTVNNLETIAADVDPTNSGFTLTVNVNDVNAFWVFDYAGRWNGGSRSITVALSNGDNYFLTRRNRMYFFYKDESDNWQWYYQPNFAG